MRTRTTIVAAAGAAILLAGSALAHDREGMRAAAQEAFAQADADRSGGLNATEFAAFHEAFRERMLARRFAALDTNQDGVVTQEELKAGHAHRGHGKGRRGHRS